MTASPPPDFDPYKTLQVDPEADQEVIQAAFRRLAQKYHPDVAQGPEAAARMVAINRAWAMLGDPDRRAAYDRERSAAVAAPTNAPPARPARATHIHHPAPTSVSPHRPPASPGSEDSSRDWAAGRSTVGGGYDPSTMRAPEGHGAAGPPPGHPSGSVLTFGRYAGWSLGEIARTDLEFLEWLDRVPIGRIYRDEIDAILRRTGRRRSAEADPGERRGLFRRR